MLKIFKKPPPPKLEEACEQEREAIYDYWDDKIVLAVNVALAAQRPLLVRGPAGCGKSSLARDVATVMKWGLIDLSINSRTTAQDLLWEFDAVARLADAQVKDLQPVKAYVKPGPLWWAFDEESAKEQCDCLATSCRATSPIQSERAGKRKVLLLDEIDKADPDLPNALLEALGERRFRVPLADVEVACKEEPPLVFVTTNDYRELSRPFLRRCVELRLELPDSDRLVEIARYHFGQDTQDIYKPLADKCVELRKGSDIPSEQRPGTAEYLDAVRACRALKIGQSSSEWNWLIEISMEKEATE